MIKNTVPKLIKYFYSLPIKDEMNSTFCLHLNHGMKILDAGCGMYRSCPLNSNLKNLYVIGVDADPNVHKNPSCDKTILCDLSKDLPFENNFFDLIYCRWVVEHLENPQKSFSEFARILKPGGKLFILTPNIYHYATIAARITPYWFHCWWRNSREGETFPTYYRANSKRRLYNLCKDTGMQIKQYITIEGPPYYLSRNWLMLLCGIFYERIVNLTSTFESFRHKILLEAQKS